MGIQSFTLQNSVTQFRGNKNKYFLIVVSVPPGCTALNLVPWSSELAWLRSRWSHDEIVIRKTPPPHCKAWKNSMHWCWREQWLWWDFKNHMLSWSQYLLLLFGSNRIQQGPLNFHFWLELNHIFPLQTGGTPFKFIHASWMTNQTWFQILILLQQNNNCSHCL